MPVTATATPSLNLSYTMVDTTADRSVSENASVGYTLQQFSNGTGYSEVNMGVTLSGVLERGLPFNIDFTGIPKSILGLTKRLNFTSQVSGGTGVYPQFGVKGILVTNIWNGLSGTGFANVAQAEMPYIQIETTGHYGFRGLFGNQRQSGIRIYPQSTWAYTNAKGDTPLYDSSSVGHDAYRLTLTDSGSGVGYEVVIVGVTGVNPYVAVH